MLALEDLKDMTEEDVKKHLVKEYGANDYIIENFEVLIAYESVGAYGCDSSSFFLLKDKEGKLYEVHGSHCSCFGFEDQFNPEETLIEALKFRIEKSNGHSVFSTGGYDNNSYENQRQVTNYILSM